MDIIFLNVVVLLFTFSKSCLSEPYEIQQRPGGRTSVAAAATFNTVQDSVRLRVIPEIIFGLLHKQIGFKTHRTDIYTC